jgi:hypothetical protein
MVIRWVAVDLRTVVHTVVDVTFADRLYKAGRAEPWILVPAPGGRRTDRRGGQCRWQSGGSVADGVECGDGGGVCVGEGVEVLLGGGESGVAHAVFDGLEVGAAGE